MSGAAKIAKTVGSVASNVFTLGGAQIAKNNLGSNSVVTKALNTPGMIVTGGLSKGWGSPGGDGGSAPGQAGFTDNPAQTLAMTGGAPLLANIALGADVKSTVAGYFGQKDYDSWVAGLSDDDKNLVEGVTGQLTQIQTNTDLKNQAVAQIVKDFPSLTLHTAQARASAGADFDEATKGYLDKALEKVGASYAANGGLSSGAMVAASARTGADLGLQKLGYEDSRAASSDQNDKDSYGASVQGWQARYNEATALRNFQNTMTGNAAGQGFSAVQASLQRTQQTKLANAGFTNAANMSDAANKNASDNALFGSIGSLVGTIGGAMIGSPTGAMAGSQLGKMVTAKAPAPTQAGDFQSNWG